MIVAHGERGGAGQDRLTHDLVEQLSLRGRYRAVTAGFIRSTPAVADARAGLPDGPVSVYPLFMSAGYYVATAIPRDLQIGADGRDGQGHQVAILRPLGLNPRLPEVVADLAAARARAVEIAPPASTLLLVAHGSSKDSKSMEAALAIAAAITQTRRFAGVETAFLEEPPFLDDALRTVSGPAIVVGLFVGEGMHGGEDLPQALDICGRRDVFLAEPLGRAPAFISLICDDAEQLDAGLRDTAAPV